MHSESSEGSTKRAYNAYIIYWFFLVLVVGATSSEGFRECCVFTSAFLSVSLTVC